MSSSADSSGQEPTPSVRRKVVDSIDDLTLRKLVGVLLLLPAVLLTLAVGVTAAVIVVAAGAAVVASLFADPSIIIESLRAVLTAQYGLYAVGGVLVIVAGATFVGVRIVLGESTVDAIEERIRDLNDEL